MSTAAAALVGTTIHLTRGQKYHGAVNVTGIENDFGDKGLHLRTQSPSPCPNITGPWLPEVIITVALADIHPTEVAAKAAIKERRAAAKAAAGPRMMAATDGNYMAMLVGATKVRSR